MRILIESPSKSFMLAEIKGKEVIISKHAYNQILNKIWTTKIENNELIIFDETDSEIDRW